MRKQSVEVRGKRTSLSLEVEFWDALHKIASGENITVQELVEQIRNGYEPASLTSAIRLFVLKHYQDRSAHQTAQGRRQGQVDGTVRAGDDRHRS